jgi:hypothetical protein
MWTPESLNDLVGDKVSGYLFVMVSNPEPYVHTFSRPKIRLKVFATLERKITMLIWRGISSLPRGASC